MPASTTAVKDALKKEEGFTSIAGIPIIPVDDGDDHFNILVYGESGVGKTVLAGSAEAVEAMSPVLLIDIEGGKKSLKDFYPRVKVVRVTSWPQLQKIYDSLLRGETVYKTVIIDSLSEAQKFSMNEIMYSARRGDPDIDPDIPRMRDWGKNIEQIRRLVRGFRDLPMNVVFTALAQTDKDNRNRVVNRILLPGKLANEVPGFVDIVTFLYIKQKGDDTQRLLLTSQTETTMAKDRSNKLPKVVEEPTMQVIYDYMSGTKSVLPATANTGDKK